MSGMWTAVAFFTVVPVPRAIGADFAPAAAVRWFAPLGLVLGAALALAAAGAWEIVPPLVAAVLLVALWIIATGALHIDGLADCADATIAPVSQERRLAILQDPAHGTFATVTVLLVVLLKVAVLASTTGREAAAAVFVAPVVARGLLPPVMRFAPVIRSGGLGEAARPGATTPVVVLSIVIAAAASILVFGWPGLAALGVAAVSVVAMGSWLVARLGGMNGDGYGAVVEMAEAVTLLAVLVLLREGYADAWEVFPW